MRSTTQSSTIRAYAAGQSLLNRGLGDRDFVAVLQAEVLRRAGRQLEDAVSPPLDPYDAVPRRQARVYLLHAERAVEEHGIDGEVHAEHVDPVARVDPHPGAGAKRTAEHQTDPAAHEGARDLQLLGQDFARALMDGFRACPHDRIG